MAGLVSFVGFAVTLTIIGFHIEQLVNWLRRYAGKWRRNRRYMHGRPNVHANNMEDAGNAEFKTERDNDLEAALGCSFSDLRESVKNPLQLGTNTANSLVPPSSGIDGLDTFSLPKRSLMTLRETSSDSVNGDHLPELSEDTPNNHSDKPWSQVENTSESLPCPPQDEKPLYVNAKQFHRILKRRVERERLGELLRIRAPGRRSCPDNSSRSCQGGMRRPRGPDARSLTAEQLERMESAEVVRSARTTISSGGGARTKAEMLEV